MKNRKDSINNTIGYRLILCLMYFLSLTNPSMAKSALIDGLTYTVMDSVKQTVCVTANCHYVTEKNIIIPEKMVKVKNFDFLEIFWYYIFKEIENKKEF